MTSTPILDKIPSSQEIHQIHLAIEPFIHHTPIMTSASINEIAGCEIFFKCENFQKIGAFKMRGAASAALSLSPQMLEKGLATHSSGNHAQAVARAAQLLGVPAYIVMPTNAPKIKRKATEGYGAKIIDCEPTPEAREATLNKVVAETGAYFIHPYNNYNVIAGQATAAKELIENVGSLDILMAPIGGGGLMSGTALAAHYWLPNAKVIGTEPKAVDDAYRSFKTGSIQYNTTTNTIADGLRTPLGDKTFPIIKEFVQDIITVEESEIVEAMKIIWRRMKIIIEPSCAVPLAALLQQKEQFKGKRVGIILTGGNVDLDQLPF